MIVPIVSLDKIYFKGSENSYFLDCTRLNGVTKLVSRKNPNDITNVEKQIYDISQKLYSQQQAQANTTNPNESSEDNTQTNNGTVYDTDYKVEEDGNNNNK